jgi:hypothetical protein
VTSGWGAVRMEPAVLVEPFFRGVQGVCGAGFLKAQSLYGARAVSLGGASL